MRRLVLVMSVLIAAGVAWSEEAAIRVAVDELVEGLACAADPSQTYTLYLPPGFTETRQWPVLLVFDPRGRSVVAAELFLEAAREHGWIIVSSNDTRSDGPWEPNIKAVNALWFEVHARIPGNPKRIYAAGFSGGATVAFTLARHSGEIAGVIACGGPVFEGLLDGMNAPVFGTAGTLDFNYQECRRLDEILGENGVPRRIAIFDGPHSWMPAAIASQAVDWLEVLAAKRGLRSPDVDLVERLYVEDAVAVEELTQQGRPLWAADRLRSAVRTYQGLRDVGDLRARADALESSPEYRSRLKEEERWRAFEAGCVQRLGRQTAVLRSLDPPPSSRSISRELRLRDLARRAGESGDEGFTAQRVLNLYHTRFSFYLAREFLGEKEYGRGATALELALKIRDDEPVTWYNLACCRAKIRRYSDAIEALKKAIECGFSQFDLIETDPDLDSLRDRDDFKALPAASAGR